MLKTLIIGADGVSPEYIFEHQELYPNISKLINNGASASYDAYVQKGYKESYVSEMNWASIYTGLHPWEHKVKLNENRECTMDQFNMLKPFWEALNDCGLSVGLWSAVCCEKPVDINGYVISYSCPMLEIPDSLRELSREITVCSKGAEFLDKLDKNSPIMIYPQTLSQQGYVYEELKENPKLAWDVIEKYHFQESLKYFEFELDYFFKSICNVQSENPVDVLFFYTPTTDTIAHSCMYCDNNDVLTKSYQLLDNFIGELVEELKPENIIVMSDHGMNNFKDLVQTDDDEVRHEAFAADDEVIWLKNGYVAFEAHNGALLFTAHSLKGMFIVAGKDIVHKKINNMRTADIYPLFLELHNVKIPDGRSGYVPDVFNRSLINEEKKMQYDLKYTSAAVLQCYSPSKTDILLNEIYVHKRFTNLTVIGEEKYREIFLNNPRVFGFKSYSDFNPEQFDVVYAGLYSKASGFIGHIVVHGRETE